MQPQIWLKLTQKYHDCLYLCQRLKVREGVAGAGEKKPGSFRPLGADLRMIKVGVWQ